MDGSGLIVCESDGGTGTKRRGLVSGRVRSTKRNGALELTSKLASSGGDLVVTPCH